MAQKYQFLNRWKKSESLFQLLKGTALQSPSLNAPPNWNCVHPKRRKCTFKSPKMPWHSRFSATFFCVFPFFQGKEPSDQHIKQVCMRVMQGETWWAFDPIYHFLCASFHGFNLSQNASLRSHVQRRPGVVSLISPLAEYSQVRRREREEGPIAEHEIKLQSLFMWWMRDSFSER